MDGIVRQEQEKRRERQDRAAQEHALFLRHADPFTRSDELDAALSALEPGDLEEE